MQFTKVLNSTSFSVVMVVAVASLVYAFFAWRQAKASKKAKKKLEATVASGKTEAYALYPRIDPNRCSGCGVCTQVCPEGDILQMVDGLPVLVAPTKCVGHSLCFRSCPVDAITMVFGTEKTGKQVPDYNENYETNVTGLYIAGELGGMGLIANAIKQGVWAANHAISKLDKSVPADVDVLVVGAGPAGIAASLKCIELKVKFKCIEQNSFGGTVYNFPRQKLVMSHPAALPLIGKMSFPGNRIVKEDLLKFWKDVCLKVGLKVDERVKFVNAKTNGKVFEVETSAGIVRARKVILAVGVGGTPRKLGLPNEDTEKVTFKLSDPEQYKGNKIVVVGAGDSAVEAAQRVGDQKLGNTVHLLVRGDALSRCKEDNKVKIEEMAKAGLVNIFYKSGIKEIHPDRVVIDKAGERMVLPNDYIILFMGTIPPFDFLKSMGIGIRTLYGEPLAK
jgi:thioredoxin reductase/Pyruvate/2-oxoacid:ferredoxin oxidoreductase delta subunit